MTRYTVVLYPYPEDELLHLWLAANDRRAFTNAANAIDRQLATDPLFNATIVEDDLYELRVAPLRVLYSGSEPDRMVKVYGVALI